MENKLIIIGASGHGKVVADLAMQCGWQIEGFLDDNPHLTEHFGFPVLGKTDQIGKEACRYVIAIGSNEVRRQIAEEHGEVSYLSLVHSSAVLGHGSKIGMGTVVMAQAVLNADAKVGRHCIVNTGAIIEHDCLVGDYTHISPGAVLAGTVIVGRECHIGAGATVRNNISICGRVTVGAGAVVVKDITEPGVYMGVPAKKMIEARG